VKAVRIHEDGGPEVLRYEDVPEPAPGPGEVLVRLAAASLNHCRLPVARRSRRHLAPPVVERPEQRHRLLDGQLLEQLRLLQRHADERAQDVGLAIPAPPQPVHTPGASPLPV